MTKRMKAMSGAALVAAAAALGTVAIAPVSVAWAEKPATSSSPFARAQDHYQRGDYRSAMIELRNALRANPNSAPARLLQAQVYLRLQQGLAAQTEIEAARKAGVKRDVTRHLMAEAMVQQRRFADALEEAKAELLPPAYAAEGARVRGLAKMGLRQVDEAKAELLQAEKLAPNSVQTKLDLARFYVASRDRKNAEASIDQALRLDPRNVRALIMKGDIVRATQGLEKSLPMFNQALAIDPQNLEARLERAATLTDLRRDKEAMADLQKIDKAVPDHPLSLYLQSVMKVRERKFQEAQALMTRTKGTLNDYPPALLLQGVIAFETNNLQQAQTYLGNLLKAAPKHSLARRLYAATLLRNGDPDGAIKEAKPLLEENPKDSRLLALVASAYVRKGQYDEAEGYLERAVAAEPNQAAIKTQLAMTRVAQGQNAEASRDLQAVLKDDPTSLQALMMAALVDMRSGDFKKGLLSADRLVKAHPNLAIGYNMRGAAFLAQSKFKEAESNFRAAIQKKPDYYEARRNLAQLLVAQKRFKEARSELSRALEADGRNAKTLMALADLSRQENKPQEQVDWLKKAIATNGDLMAPRLRLIQAYLDMKKPNDALSEANALSRDFPNNPAALEAIGRTQIATKQTSAAAGTFEKLTKVVPDDVRARVLYARALAEDKRLDAARRAYTMALNLKNQDLSQVYLDLMALEARSGNFTQAIAHANALKAKYPKSNIADRALGDLYMGARQWDKAITSYETARKSGFDRALAISLSRAYVNAKKPDQGVAVLQAWLKREPKDAAARIALADIHMSAKRYNQAIAEYNALGQAGQRSPIVLNNMAWMYSQMNDKRAVSFAEQAYKLAPNSPEIADTLGHILVQQRVDPKRGLAIMQKAVAKKPNDPDMRYHLALALRANGKPADAVRELENILSKHKSFENVNLARQVLQQLKSGAR